MEKYQDKIIVYKTLDKEVFKLLCAIDVTPYGVIKFDNECLKEIKMHGGRVSHIIVEKRISLKDDVKDSINYGDSTVNKM